MNGWWVEGEPGDWVDGMPQRRYKYRADAAEYAEVESGVRPVIKAAPGSGEATRMPRRS